MKNSIAWKNGVWLTTEDASLAMNDIGFLQGVVIVDRLRTLGGSPLDVPEHVDRFQQSCQSVGMVLPESGELREIVGDCVLRNQQRIEHSDFAIILIATPGIHGHPQRPTLIVHPLEIPWPRIASWYTCGQRLCYAQNCSVPAECWTPAIKTRARLHYYLADQAACTQTGDPHASAVLLDRHAFLTETSSANILIVEGKQLISPRRESILSGISLRRTLRIAESSGMEVRFDDISVDRAASSDAMLLCGSTACIWPASQFADRVFDNATLQPAYLNQSHRWQQDVGFNFVEQALALGIP